LGEAITKWFAEEVPTRAYRLSLGDAGRLRWIDRREGVEVVQEAEPGTSVWRRFAVALLSVLPIEWLL
jgi:cardiolipin synthase C